WIICRNSRSSGLSAVETGIGVTRSADGFAPANAAPCSSFGPTLRTVFGSCPGRVKRKRAIGAPFLGLTAWWPASYGRLDKATAYTSFRFHVPRFKKGFAALT